MANDRSSVWLMRAVLACETVVVEHEQRLLRALEQYELHRLDFTDCYLAACAELSGTSRIVTFDRNLDEIESVARVE